MCAAAYPKKTSGPVSFFLQDLQVSWQRGRRRLILANKQTNAEPDVWLPCG
jgi:hypothetical protein